MRAWERVEQAPTGREGWTAARNAAPVALGLMLGGLLTGAPVGRIVLAGVVGLATASVFGLAVHWQSRRGGSIKRVYDLLPLLGLALLVGGFAWLLA